MAKNPNIVFILADDLGYGDVACLNPRCRIPTPNLDRLASGGMTFTDAHASSSVCSPSRYGVLTGRYNWRSCLQKGIVGTYGPALIGREQLTVPRLLGQADYNSACVGKWHLGWDWPLEMSEYFRPDRDNPTPQVTQDTLDAWEEAFSQPIDEGPTTRGFDTYFGVDVPNWPPYAFIEDDRLQGVPTEYLPADLIGNNQASVPGPALEGWKLEAILPALRDRACDYIAESARKEAPFFLYMPLTSPHTPLAVNDEWKGESGLNLYADFVMETDDVIGDVLDAVDESGASDNTLVMFASDNGCAPYIGVPELEDMGHYPSAHYRGYKADAWDGGHRIPLFARWPKEIQADSKCAQAVCLTDLLATCGDITGKEIPEESGEDSFSILRLLNGRDEMTREEVIHHSISGKFAIRTGKWKLVLCPGSGGWASPTDEEAIEQGLPPIQLYDMEQDPGEQNNLESEREDVVEKLSNHLADLVNKGRSTPGKPLENDVEVDIWKRG
ncbi:MAG: sulfatase family protein [Candidatus Brocadiia bacterium]